MEVVRDLDAARAWGRPRAVAVGFFDGVHLGHQELLSRLTRTAAGLGGVSAVLTFDPHPLALVRPGAAPALLTSIPQKAAIMEKLGVDHLMVLPFVEQLRELDPLAFVRQVLVEGLETSAVLVGFNFTFGYRGQGNASVLSRLAAPYGISVEVVPPVRAGGTVVSSTEIRRSLLEGQVERARELLGRPHRLCGTVVRGSGRGRSLGYPTCNLMVDDRVLVPAGGVYAVMVELPGGARTGGVCNVGNRPTFGGQDTTIEVHIIERDGDWYGQLLCVDLMGRLRSERAFASSAALSRQISRDIQRVLRLRME